MNIISRIDRFDALPMFERIDLKRLGYFIAVAEAGNFSRAAERLNLAQSHLSRQIMRLESVLGQRLFVRRARHVELTDAGQILLQETGFITSRLNGLPERMNQAAAGSLGSLCIGFTVAGSYSSLPAKIIGAVTREEPQLSLRFCVETRTDLIEAIVDRRVQAVFARKPSGISSEVRIDELFSEPIVLAVARTHRLAKDEKVDLSNLAEESLILCERNLAPEEYDAIISGCQDVRFTPRVIFHAPEPSCALLLAAAGIGITLVPASMRSIHAEDLHFARLTGDTLSTSLALITRVDEHMASVKLLRKHAIAMGRVAGRASAAM
jgi:DNA-binding transcriptional LysR family regulator